jgi:hypothetical protein
MRRFSQITFCFVSMVVLGLVGCADDVGNQNSSSQGGGAPAEKDHHADHDEIGPNGGHLIELGHSHKYHAELVENDAAKTVTVFILDADMKPLSIGAGTISLSLKVADATKSFELVGAGDGEDTSSFRFESNDLALFETLEESHEVSGKLRVTIDDTPYVGLIEHHDHDHGHQH